MDRAIELGYIVEGWKKEDYLRDSVDHEEWESHCLWGPKGGGKSNQLLQDGFLVYQDWEKVKQNLVMDPLDFLYLTKYKDKRIAWLGWDDISVHLPRTLYFTNRNLWAAFKSNWDAFRTKLSAFQCTTPLKTKVATFFLEDLSGEIMFAKRVKGAMVMPFDFQRWMWDLDYENPFKVRFGMICVERSFWPFREQDKTNLYHILKKYHEQRKDNWTEEMLEAEVQRWPGVPDHVWNWYKKRREELAEKALDRLYTLIEEINKKEQGKTQVTSSDVQRAASILAQASHARK